MTIQEILIKNNINFDLIVKEKGNMIFKVGELKILVNLNQGNIFKLSRKNFDVLASHGGKFALWLIDSKENKHYYLKFINKNNWLTNSFVSSSKSELNLGKEVLKKNAKISVIMEDLALFNKK